jgi:hypothetical protein
VQEQKHGEFQDHQSELEVKIGTMLQRRGGNSKLIPELYVRRRHILSEFQEPSMQEHSGGSRPIWDRLRLCGEGNRLNVLLGEKVFLAGKGKKIFWI